MLIVGITGSFGTGKTTVSKIFRNFGVKVIDADKISRNILKPGTKAFRAVVRNFGKEILLSDRNKIDRKKLAEVVFGNKAKVKKLSRIIHPLVIKEMKKEVALYRKLNKKIVVIDAPLLIEADLLSLVDKLLVVKVKNNVQFKRLQSKRGFNSSQIAKRIKAQLSIKKKISLADYVIDNSGSLTNTKKQVKKIWENLRTDVKIMNFNIGTKKEE